MSYPESYGALTLLSAGFLTCRGILLNSGYPVESGAPDTTGYLEWRDIRRSAGMDLEWLRDVVFLSG